jgi:transposase
MEQTGSTDHIKRTQKDYSLPFKLQVVEEVEKGHLTYKQAQIRYGIQGKSTVLVWLRKHGRLDWTKGRKMKNKQIPEQRIKELERELKRLKGDKEILEIALDVAKEDLGIDIRKKYLAKLSEDRKKKDTR